MERYNNATSYQFKLDKYEKIVDVTNSFQLAKAGQYTTLDYTDSTHRVAPKVSQTTTKLSLNLLLEFRQRGYILLSNLYAKDAQKCRKLILNILCVTSFVTSSVLVIEAGIWIKICTS